MRYLGGKFRLKGQIGTILNLIRENNQTYWEPFVGAAWVTTEIARGPVFCSDVNKYLIAMWEALMEGWVPPSEISENQYYYVKEHPNENPALTAFVGFGCSWGGKWFGGYAREESRNRAREARNSLLGKIEKLRPINPAFFVYDFLIQPHPFQGKNCLIYCDPPYKGTTGYEAVDSWNSGLFWVYVRKLTEQGHTVVVSEYVAPKDFSCITHFQTKTDLNTKNGKEKRIEKLFVHKSIEDKFKDLNGSEQTSLF